MIYPYPVNSATTLNASGARHTIANATLLAMAAVPLCGGSRINTVELDEGLKIAKLVVMAIGLISNCSPAGRADSMTLGM